MIALLSMFRDSMDWAGHPINQVDTYFRQWESQTIRATSYYCLEGDSKDDTTDVLAEYVAKMENLYVINKTADYNRVISSTDPARIKSMANLANKLLEFARTCDNYQWFLWCESDLIVPKDLIEKLVRSAESIKHRPIIMAPFPFHKTRKSFYDTWAFRHLNDSPLYSMPKDIVELKSIGSCALISASLIYGGINFGDGAFPELCSQATKKGAKIYADPSICIWHPDQQYIAGRLI